MTGSSPRPTSAVSIWHNTCRSQRRSRNSSIMRASTQRPSNLSSWWLLNHLARYLALTTVYWLAQRVLQHHLRARPPNAVLRQRHQEPSVPAAEPGEPALNLAPALTTRSEFLPRPTAQLQNLLLCRTENSNLDLLTQESKLALRESQRHLQ